MARQTSHSRATILPWAQDGPTVPPLQIEAAGFEVQRVPNMISIQITRRSGRLANYGRYRVLTIVPPNLVVSFENEWR